MLGQVARLTGRASRACRLLSATALPPAASPAAEHSPRFNGPENVAALACPWPPPPAAGTLGSSARPFFSLGSSSGQLQTHRERRVVSVPPDLFFDVVANVDEYKHFLPFCVHSQVLKRPSETEMIAEMGIGFRVFREDYTSRVKLDRAGRRISIKAIKSPTFTTLTSSWQFKEVPGKPDHTAVDFTVEFGVSNSLLQSAVDVVFNDVTRQQVKAFEARCRKIAVARPTPPSSQPTGPGRPSDSSLRTTVESIQDQEVAAVVMALSAAAPQFQPGVPDVAALLEDKNDCLVAASVELSKVRPELSCSRGFALLAADAGLRAALAQGLAGLCLGQGFLGKPGGADSGARGRSRVEVLGRALHLLLTDKQADERAGLIFCMADFNGSGQINQAELKGMLHSHLRLVSAAVPWLMDQSDVLGRPGGRQGDAAAVTELLRSEVESEVPAAVAQIFADLDQDGSNGISQAEWEYAWRKYPELVDLMSLEGMNRMVHWATVSSQAEAA